MALFKKDTKKTDKDNAKTDDKLKKNESATDKGQSMKDLYGNDETAKTTKKDTEKKSVGQDSETVVTQKQDVKKQYGNAFRVLVKPLITEKISDLGELNKYAFEVYLNANKVEIAKAIKEVYGVRPVKINIMKTKGKVVRVGRITGKRKDRKKAIITLAKSDDINIYEGI